MDWEQLAIIAQIATGVATLALAAFLVRQIALQRQALELAHRDSERAHKDSERELLYTSNRLYTDIMGRIIDPDFGPIWRQGRLDFDSLAPDEQIQFQMWCQISHIFQATNFRTGHDGVEREGGASRIEVQNQVAWSNWPGVATVYERFGRQQTYDSDLRQLLDRVFLETQGREVEKTWVMGVNNRDS